ncbi:unnamed protein product [Aphanomyces euteiches]|uniref:FAM86 N-terminal domain-containing protein n=1 Tax=Aphanomyces euteiches TaxID=100861 RepID=A0A6G0WE50_9STRA|nr:hypothetical protein Ae201684_015916 [Aphanomyces euteiches]KAH9088415.1 hypothetical protein Ae201684P_003108 [Aphanomyces euteiches]KAH9149793.1 hypothetical protein AeRB84_007252 [Aphanomyces euteiches]
MESDKLGFTHWATDVSYSFCGEEIQVVQDPSSHVLGSTVWDSAKCFLKFVEKNRARFDVSRLKRKKGGVVSVCELGAGLGLAGMALAKLGFIVVLTDVAPVLPWLHENVALNFTSTERAERVFVAEYGWGTPPTLLTPPYDMIVCADVVYEVACVKPLVKSILALATRKTIIYLTNERRTQAVQDELMRYLNEYFVWTRLPTDVLDDEYTKGLFNSVCSTY